MTKDLSIIIVNYNVCYFLEQTLKSVFSSLQNLNIEVFVVDNASVDGSVSMVKSKFKKVILIESKENLGFSKANNLAIRKSNGKYVLLLNPDTVVQEDTFVKCFNYMEQNTKAGGLGVYMVDGKGKFLPESKRGLPTPWVAFYKITGIASLFPKSKKFGKYHLGFLENDKIHEIEILSGAFMWLRKSTLDEIGLLDEDYFMYGEDIDLSYRITKAGYSNIYYPETRIIHYKGESTKKSSLNYVYVFYNAMAIFAKKHFTKSYASSFSFLITLAIWAKATLQFFGGLFKKYAHIFLDYIILTFGTISIKNFWEEYVKYSDGNNHYPESFSLVVIPIYALTWILTSYFSGSYDKPHKIHKIIRGVLFGALLISALTNFLDVYRYSKAVIILGSVWAIISMIFTRYLYQLLKFKRFNFEDNKDTKIIIIGSFEEANRVLTIIQKNQKNINYLGFITSEKYEIQQENYLGNIHNIVEIVGIYKPNEVIFCSKNMPSHDIISFMSKMDSRLMDFKIVPDDSNFVIGSNSKDAQGELYVLDIELNITNKNNIRSKRLTDILVSLFFILLSPFLVFIMENKTLFLKRLFLILIGKQTFVGFKNSNSTGLPKLKMGILSPSSEFENLQLDAKTIEKLDLIYAKNYQPSDDLNIIGKSLRLIGK